MARRPHRIWLADSVEKFCLDLMLSVLPIIFIWRFHQVAQNQRMLDSELDTEVTYHKIRDLKIEVWSFYCKLNEKLWLTVSRYSSAGVWDLRLAGCGSSRLPCLPLTSYFSWEIVFKVSNYVFWNRIRQSIRKKSSKKLYFFSNEGLWCFRARKTSACGKSLTSWAV